MDRGSGDDGFHVDVDGRDDGQQPYGFVVVVLIAGARFHARTSRRASKTQAGLTAWADKNPNKSLTRASQTLTCAYLT